MYLERKRVQCRNCGYEQDYNTYNGFIPSTTSSIAVCNSCGFKSIWYNELVKQPDDPLEAARLIINDNVEFIKDD